MPLYKPDPNDSTKQVPNPTFKAQNKFSTAIAPPPYPSVSKRPSYVVINSSGSYAFQYDSGSIETFVTASTIGGGDGTATQSPIRLDINPIGWRKTEGDAAETVGEVTFVYVRVG